MTQRLLAASLLLVLASVAWGAGTTVAVEDWMSQPPGHRGIPAGWQDAATPGRAARNDLRITHDAEYGGHVLHLRSEAEHTNILKRVDVDLAATPILEWSWKVVTLPAGGDIRHARSSDLAAQLYVVWERFPRLLNSQLLGYVWDAAAPAGYEGASQKSSRIRYVVLESGAGKANRWVTESRDVAADYRRAFAREPTAPAAIILSIDSNDTGSRAESYVGRIAFRSR